MADIEEHKRPCILVINTSENVIIHITTAEMVNVDIMVKYITVLHNV